MLTAGAVKAAVAGLDSLVDVIGAGVVADLPQTKAHEGHVVAAVQLDGRGNHFAGSAECLKAKAGQSLAGCQYGRSTAHHRIQSPYHGTDREKGCRNLRKTVDSVELESLKETLVQENYLTAGPCPSPSRLKDVTESMLWGYLGPHSSPAKQTRG